MRHLPKPLFGAQSTFEACVDSLDAGDLKTRLSSIANQIVAAETDYLHHGEQNSLYSIATAKAVGAASLEDMKRLYKGTFVRSVKTRHLYHTLKKLPQNDTCPLCSQRTVTTLDHYLAQSLHPALVVTPANLVPACSECNKLKLDKQPASAVEQTLHPYFDNLDSDRWLYADVRQTRPAGLLFRASPPAAWPDIKKARVARHFQVFGLGALYASHAASELTSVREYLGKVMNAGGQAAVREFLNGLAESASAAHLNSWKAASYFAFSESDWFCGGGFSQT